VAPVNSVAISQQIYRATSQVFNEADRGLDLQVRVGVNTREVVVAVGARTEQGEGIVRAGQLDDARLCGNCRSVDSPAWSSIRVWVRPWATPRICAPS
jgi:class 3 adenylate cyclase